MESEASLLIRSGRSDSRGGGAWRMWTAENRSRYDRSRLRYPSDMTDAEWG